MQWITAERNQARYPLKVQIWTAVGRLMMRITGGIERGWVGRLAPLVVLAGSILGCSSSVGPTEPSAAETTTEIEYQLLQMSNRERTGAGVVQELVPDSALSDIARRYSEEMRDRGFFSHSSPDGTTLRQRLDRGGIDSSRAGENIAQVSNASNPAVLAHDLLMDSERHRANILDREFRQVGIGVARSSDTFWITQIFVTP